MLFAKVQRLCVPPLAITPGVLLVGDVSVLALRFNEPGLAESPRVMLPIAVSWASWFSVNFFSGAQGASLPN